MRKLLLAFILLLLTACTDDDFQNQFAGYPTSHTQTDTSSEEISSAGIMPPELTGFGEGD